MIRQVEKLLDEQIRPALAAHGGNVELIDIDNNNVFVKLTGGCQGCSSSQATLKDGIARLLKQNFFFNSCEKFLRYLIKNNKNFPICQ